jgi:hypothetical protein
VARSGSVFFGSFFFAPEKERTAERAQLMTLADLQGLHPELLQVDKQAPVFRHSLTEQLP